MNRSDNFNRADNASSLGTPSDAGSGWVNITGFGTTNGIESNRAWNSGGGNTRFILEASESDGTVSIDIPVRANIGDGRYQGVVFRCEPGGSGDESTASGLEFRANFGNTMEIVEISAPFASANILASTTRAYADGDIFSVVFNGTSIQCYHNGVNVTALNVTSSHNLTSTKHGMRWGGNVGRYDNFSFVGGGGGGSVVDAFNNYLSCILAS